MKYLVSPSKFPEQSHRVCFDFDAPRVNFNEDNVVFVDYCVVNGDYVNVGDHLLLLRLTFRGRCSYFWIKANTNGYFQRVMKLEQKIEPEDTLGLIHPPGVYSKENSPLQESFRYHFNASRLTRSNPKSKFPLSPDLGAICYWNKKDNDFVNEGDPIFTITHIRFNKSLIDNSPIGKWLSCKIEPLVHKAEKTGRLQIFPNRYDESVLFPKRLVYRIHQSP